MKLKPSYFLLFSGLLTLIIMGSCSTEKDALLNKGYHNMTARFNGYYNAGVIIDESLVNYRAKYQEDYTKVLSPDLFPTEADAPSLFPEMDDAIERCEKVIVRHSMPNPERVKNKSEENCRWIDDNWLVVGQAYYIKREYETAKARLKYVAENYNGEASVYEARIWLAKTYIALGQYSEAKRTLVLVQQAIERSNEEKGNKEKKKRPSKLERQRAKKAKKKKKDKGPAKFPKRLLVDYEVVSAELYMAQEETKKAITHMENAVKACRNKKRRARYMFVLAQLYGEQGNGNQASVYYNKVARSNAPYEMRFKAKIRKALTASGSSEELVKELTKMLKDAKNIEYKDQIYYALAELDMKKPDVEAAKANYTQSALWSIKNDRQKGESYLRLADIHFGERDYLNAQKYYDSSVTVLPKDYEGYEKLKNKAEGLADLVFNYETVQFEDSVQRIGAMSEKEREKYLEKTLKKIKEEEARKKEEAERRLVEQQKRVNQSSGGSGSKWYFYNNKQVASGFNDFRVLWGQRPLEDNWRRANKNALVSFDNGDGEVSDSTQTEDNELTTDDLLKDIPLTASAIDSSNTRILNALYNLGIIYKEQLKEDKEAESYFQAVIDRKIEHPKVLPALYQLYLMAKKKNSPKTEQYKTAIIKNYPESEIAQILLDPNYLEKKDAKNREELVEYSNTLRSYRMRHYGVVVSKCNSIIANEPNNQFIRKYYLLKAFAVSKMSSADKQPIIDPLEKLYADYPESEEGKQAKLYLDKLRKGENIVEEDEPKPETPFIFDEKAKHFFLVAIPEGDGDVNDTKIKVANFNSAFFRTDRLSLKDAPLGAKYQVLVVRTFDNLNKAQTYLTSFKSERAKANLGSIASDYDICLISAKNFAELFKTKDISGYMDFYQTTY